VDSIDVEGAENRVAGRDIRETTVHQNIIGAQLNIGSLPDREPLTLEQRKRLNLLVADIARDYKVDARTLWKEVVHTRIGVRNIDEILRDQFPRAEQLLLERREQLHAQAHAKRLVAEVLEIANRRDQYQELMRFCSREFGITVLNRLNPEQLKQALRFIEERGIPPVEPEKAANAVRKPELNWMKQMLMLWSEYPRHMWVVVAISAIAGRIFL